MPIAISCAAQRTKRSRSTFSRPIFALWQMSTGKRAFERKSQASLIAAIMNTEPAPLGALDDEPRKALAPPLLRSCPSAAMRVK